MKFGGCFRNLFGIMYTKFYFTCSGLTFLLFNVWMVTFFRHSVVPAVLH